MKQHPSAKTSAGDPTSDPVFCVSKSSGARYQIECTTPDMDPSALSPTAMFGSGRERLKSQSLTWPRIHRKLSGFKSRCKIPLK